MKKKHLFFAALFLAALAFGFVGCENPDSQSGISIEKPGDDSTSDKPNDSEDGDTKPTTPEAPMLVATGGASDVEYSTVTLWGRINTDTLWAFPNIKWGIEYAYDYNTIAEHKHQETTKVLCSTPLQGENVDEFSVEISGIEQRKIYYSAYILINDMKYIYGEVDSVHLDVKLTVNSNNTSYGTVTGSGIYDHLAEVTITATLKDNCYFTGWSDCDSKELTRTITLTSDSTITANFAMKSYLSVKSNKTSYGTVTGSGYYMPGDEVTITATPKLGFEFVKWSDGNTDNPRIITMGNADITYAATFEVIPMEIAGTESGYAYVDLGLSVKWATCNVGANNPEEYGNYYAWGETTPKTSYSWSTYKWCNGSRNTMTKYCTDSDYGTVDNKTVLDKEDDAAAVNMGGSWRMPTKAEQDELRTECTWTWTSDYNGTGKKGRIVVGKNGNHIFLPAGGYRDYSDLDDAGSSGFYWSSSLSTGHSGYAFRLDFNSAGMNGNDNYRYLGRSVRGVCP